MKAVCLYCVTAAYKQQTITYHGVFWLIPIYKITIMLTFYDKINAKVQFCSYTYDQKANIYKNIYVAQI